MTNLDSDEWAKRDDVALDPSRLVFELLGFVLPAECAPGVLVALEDLAEHFRRLRGPVDAPGLEG